MNQPKQAEKIYREDQQYNPGTGWSLWDYTKALLRSIKKKKLLLTGNNTLFLFPMPMKYQLHRCIEY